MKIFLFSLFLALSALTVSAQTDSVVQVQPQPRAEAVHHLRFGYLSCDSALHALPAYAIAKKKLDDLKGQYDAEMKRVEDEFNAKYELFLEQQADFAPTIRQKRQAELQELMEKNVAFKKEAQRLLAEAEKESLDPIRKTVNAAITQIGQQRHLAFIINTDSGSLPYVDTTLGEDITAAVIRSAR